MHYMAPRLCYHAVLYLHVVPPEKDAQAHLTKIFTKEKIILIGDLLNRIPSKIILLIKSRSVCRLSNVRLFHSHQSSQTPQLGLLAHTLDHRHPDHDGNNKNARRTSVRSDILLTYS